MDRTGRWLPACVFALTLPGIVLLGVALGAALASGYLVFLAVQLVVTLLRRAVAAVASRWRVEEPLPPPVTLAFPGRR
jgi:hypothetical protein